MNSYFKSCSTIVICGETAKFTKKFNERTTIEQIHDYIHQEFGASLPQPYRIMSYDSKKMLFVDLEDQLRERSGLFVSNLSHRIQTTSDLSISKFLYIINESSNFSDTHYLNQKQYDQTISTDNDEHASNNEIRTASPFSLSSNFTNDDVSSDNTGCLSNIDADLSTTIVPLSTQQQDGCSYLSHRMMFSLDVNPRQRDVYKSDEFSIRSGKPNGRITRIQGLKTEKQKMCQVLPRLRISTECLQSNVKLLVIAVYEELSHGKRIWYKNPNKGFLPDHYSKDTEPINPIEIDLNRCQLADNGDFILSLQMITKWNRSNAGFTKIYQLNEEQSIQLHPSEHDSSATRLLCVLRKDECYDWNTFCLSDFIRSPKSQKQRSSSAITEHSHLSKYKRLKIDTYTSETD